MPSEKEQKNSSVFSIIKRKTNSAGLRLIQRLNQIFKRWPDQFCLITGAPRSGTTAMEQWLNRQNKVVALHETRILRTTHRFLEEAKLHNKLDPEGEFTNLARNIAYQFYSTRCSITENELMIDKEPLVPIGFPNKEYALFLENYRLLFPHGKLLFMIRDPLSTIWSMQERKWGYSIRNYTPRKFNLEFYIENWCDCADIIIDYADDNNTCICSFETLVKNPENESGRIFDFLNISRGEPFQPQEVKTVGFSDDERDLIQSKTKNHVLMLKERRILDIQFP